MILYCNFEEVTALAAASARALDRAGAGHHPIVAPPELIADLELLAARANGDISITTLDEQRALFRAVDHLLDEARGTMDDAVLEMHAADENAVAAYFEYAHLLAVFARVKRMGDEMRAVIELLTGEPPSAESQREFTFPD
jgi:hypothetical protein